VGEPGDDESPPYPFLNLVSYSRGYFLLFSLLGRGDDFCIPLVKTFNPFRRLWRYSFLFPLLPAEQECTNSGPPASIALAKGDNPFPLPLPPLIFDREKGATVFSFRCVKEFSPFPPSTLSPLLQVIGTVSPLSFFSLSVFLDDHVINYSSGPPLLYFLVKKAGTFFSSFFLSSGRKSSRGFFFLSPSPAREKIDDPFLFFFLPPVGISISSSFSFPPLMSKKGKG